MASATRTRAIVSSIFPKNVQDRLLQEAEEQQQDESRDEFLKSQRDRIQPDAPPIADLFPSATVMFAGTYRLLSKAASLRTTFTKLTCIFPHLSTLADIVGFTAWSCKLNLASQV